MSSARRRALLLVSLLAGPTLAARAQAEFGNSSLSAPAEARELDPVEFVLTLRNTGFEPPVSFEAHVTLPPSGLFVSASPGLRFDPAERSLAGSPRVGPGQAVELRFTLLAAPQSDGTLLSPMASLRSYPAGGTTLHASVAVGPRRRPGELVPLLGPFQATRAGLAVLAFLAVAAAGLGAAGLVAAARRRAGRRAASPVAAIRGAAAVVVAAGFLAIFAGLARDDARLFSHYREAVCTVTDGAGRAQLSRSGQKTTVTVAPAVAVRFELQGRQVFGAGFDGPTRLGIGGGEALARALEPFATGAVVPCWYDPDDPARVVVRRGPGGAYLFALFPLPVLLLGLWQLRRGLALGAG